MVTIQVLDDPAAAAAAVDPLRSRILSMLSAGPASAAALASRLGLPRQKVRYHLRALEERHLIFEVEQRQHGGIVERLYRSKGDGYLVSPAVLGPAAADPRQVVDRLSASYLLALAGQAIREVGELVRGAEASAKTVPTLSIEVDICFATPSARSAFAEDLADAVRAVAAAHHDESDGDGRWYRLVAFSHPRLQEEA